MLAGLTVAAYPLMLEKRDEGVSAAPAYAVVRQIIAKKSLAERKERVNGVCTAIRGGNFIYGGASTAL
jgi:hypothetical protein